MKYVKVEDDQEIIFNKSMLPDFGFYPVVEHDRPEPRLGYRIVRQLILRDGAYHETYEYVHVGDDDELTAEEADFVIGGAEL